jgi:hypothetical protein
MLHPCLSDLWNLDGSEQETPSLSVEAFLALSGGVPSGLDRMGQERRARIQCLEEDDVVF